MYDVSAMHVGGQRPESSLEFLELEWQSHAKPIDVDSGNHMGSLGEQEVFLTPKLSLQLSWSTFLKSYSIKQVD